MRFATLFFLVSLAGITSMLFLAAGCAQIGFPTGGPRDTIAPVLLKAIPAEGSTGFRSNKITLVFDEYVEVQDLQRNLIISPSPAKNPVITYNLRIVSIQLKDTLQPNTTYSIQMGDAIKDLNEGNVLKNFSYVFSTGKFIDSLTLSGRVVMAETGQADSTLWVMLYRSLADTAVLKNKPDYISRPSGDGSFTFKNLPAGSFSIYALKDNDGGRTYNDLKEPFAFSDSPVVVKIGSKPVELFAYRQLEEKKEGRESRLLPEKKFRMSNDLSAGFKDIAGPLTIAFNNTLRKFDTSGISLLDSNNRKVNSELKLDSTRKKLLVNNTWQEGMAYKFIVPVSAMNDSSGNGLLKDDTLNFSVRPKSYYGRVLLRFSNEEKDGDLLLQLLQGEEIRFSGPVKNKQWKNELVNPGEYSIRLILDKNRNGKWDPGEYSTRRQPEKGILLSQKLSVRGDWDNERDISN